MDNHSKAEVCALDVRCEPRPRIATRRRRSANWRDAMAPTLLTHCAANYAAAVCENVVRCALDGGVSAESCSQACPGSVCKPAQNDSVRVSVCSGHC
jgi:hypothetical protein